jgi:hypothetical protein
MQCGRDGVQVVVEQVGVGVQRDLRRLVPERRHPDPIGLDASQLLVECFFVDLLEVEAFSYLDADVVPHHQLSELLAVDGSQLHGDVRRELSRA